MPLGAAILAMCGSGLVGLILGMWLGLRSIGKLDATLDELDRRDEQRTERLADPAPTEDTLTLSEIRASLSPVPRFGLPESRFHHQGQALCCQDGYEIPRGDSYVFIPLTNGVAGSGLIICNEHAGEVAEDARELEEDPADI